MGELKRPAALKASAYVAMLLSPGGASAFHFLPTPPPTATAAAAAAAAAAAGGLAPPACRRDAPPVLASAAGRCENRCCWRNNDRPPRRLRRPCSMQAGDGGVRSGGNGCGRPRAAGGGGGVGALRCSSQEVLSSTVDQQAYTVVTTWRYEGSAVDVPWRSLGDMLFEMGACWCSVYVGEEEEEEEEEGLERQGHRKQGPGETEAVQWGRGAMLTFALEEGGGGDVGAVLEAACALAGGPDDCFAGSLDWEEGPAECFDQWEATRSSEGFDTVTMRRLQISAVQRREEQVPSSRGLRSVKLLEGQGWGDGEHPSTWMCLDFLESAVEGGEEVVDYGTGSGVLAAAAAVLGAKHVTAIDIDVEILAHARQNFLLNGISEKVLVLHGREVSIGDLSAEIVVANMIAGPMRRQMATLVLAVKEGGLLCLSGLRPSDAPLIRSEFGKYMDWDVGLEASRESPTWGEYVRLVGRPKPGLALGGGLRAELEKALSEAAVA
ncbi:unnamed protein product [Ectocarpus sp. 6 AP-2014]